MYRNPIPTVDIIIEVPRGIVLIQRKNPPYGWALPGGFVDYGESLEMAAIREAAEETGLEIELLRQLYTYSNPSRDSRHHTISTVFIAKADGIPNAGSDAALVTIAAPPWPVPLVFDHETILSDYIAFRKDRFFNPLMKSVRGL
jgi:ADP-ribose pyrophosphatase YjhB (NUDIX family)